MKKIFESLTGFTGQSTKPLHKILDTFNAVKADLKQFIEAKQQENLDLYVRMDALESTAEENLHQIERALHSLEAVSKLVGE